MGKADAYPSLPFLQLLFQQESRNEKTEPGHPCEQQERIESGKRKNRQEAKGGEQDAEATIDGDVLRVTISSLKQPGPGLGTLGGRHRQGAAEGVEGLLHAFADRGFSLCLGALPADFAEARSEHRRGRRRGRAKGEHDHYDGEEGDNREYQRQRHESDLYFVVGRRSLVVGKTSERVTPPND